MKKGIFIFMRVTFVLGAMLFASYYGTNYYYLYQSRQAIHQALQSDNGMLVDGDVSHPFPIIEFFDYQCPHCAAMSQLVSEAVAEDENTKVLLRPVAVRGEESLKISAFVLALDRQRSGASVVVHHQIMALSDFPSYGMVKDMAREAGLNVEQAEKDAADFTQAVLYNTELLSDIGFNGVPALIIGDKGYIPTQAMPGINELRLMMLDAKARLKISN